MTSLGFCNATCQFKEPQTFKQFGGKWWSSCLWPSAAGIFTILCSLDTNKGKLWCVMLNLRRDGSLGGQYVPARLMMVRGGEVATWSCVSSTVTADTSTSDNLIWIPNAPQTHTHRCTDTHAYINIHICLYTKTHICKNPLYWMSLCKYATCERWRGAIPEIVINS